MTVRLTAVGNGTLLTDGEEHKGEGMNSQTWHGRERIWGQNVRRWEKIK